MSVIEEFKRLPNNLGIRFTITDFEKLVNVINDEIKKIPERKQRIFYEFCNSFKTNGDRLSKEAIDEIHNEILSDEENINYLKTLINGVKENFGV